MKHLSTNEIKLIETALNDNTREGQLDDNYSNLGLEDVQKVLECTLEEAVSFCDGSPWFSAEDEEDCKGRTANFPQHAIVDLTEEAINAYFDMKEAQLDTVLIGGKLFATTAKEETISMAINLVNLNAVDDEDKLDRVESVIRSLGYTIATSKSIKEYNL